MDTASGSKEIPDRHRIGRRWKMGYAAASILLVISAVVWLRVHHHTNERIARSVEQDIAPGGNKAILTLAGGQQIVLADVQRGKVAEQEGAAIEKTADGTIRYDAVGTPGAIPYNTISTPRGGQYAVMLADGTKVILNAASVLRYPATFAGGDRKVELSGEAWFEVARDKGHPFIVMAGGQQVDVLGTSFNLNAYEDEPDITTTLVTGSVRISDSITRRSGLLRPGQQSILKNHNLSFMDADTKEATAWKDGYFVFQSEDISSIMRKIARWYDVNVVFTGPKPTDLFNGSIQRYVNVSQVLRKLAFTSKVHFTVEGRKIEVSR
jgi:ferric-dicitrate binding protein FerR (iron transport regulator)